MPSGIGEGGFHSPNVKKLMDLGELFSVFWSIFVPNFLLRCLKGAQASFNPSVASIEVYKAPPAKFWVKTPKISTDSVLTVCSCCPATRLRHRLLLHLECSLHE